MTRRKSRLFYLWRVLATGFAFAMFGLGGPIIAVGISIFVGLAPIRTPLKSELSRVVLRHTFKLYIGLLKFLGLLTYEIQGLEFVAAGRKIVVANHPSLLDVVFLLSIIRGATCIVKDSLTKNWFTRPPILAANYIRNNSENLIASSTEALAAESPLVIFPEGTRTKPGADYRLQRGAANIALSAKCDISPVVISCKPATLLKNEKWYKVPDIPPHFVISFRPPIKIQKYLDMNLHQCQAARILTKDLAAYYEAARQEDQCVNTTLSPA
ncbi:MAG: 1-acyl-sn-glycerol-3-phosphate acyltransferase [Alteromonadaceae bacterium]|nr:MAG: 1-acyl-sn-glycerol-3-phosphate acyltransferase [Alteromonadaceae bacterium]